MSLVTNKSESERIQKIQNKTVYANYLANQTRFQGGCDTLLMPIQSGSAAFKSASIMVDIRLGENYTTVQERDAIITTNTCPVLYIVYSLLTTGLVLYLDASNSLSYPGTGTTWKDLSPDANNGNIVYSPTYVSSPIKCFSLVNPISFPGGTNQRINLSKKNIGDDFSICAWINTTNKGKGNTSHLNLMWIVGAETSGTPTPPAAGDFGFGICADGKLGFGCSPQDFTLIQSKDIVNTGAWVNVVMTRARVTGSIKFYINGVASGSGLLQANGSILNATTPSIGFPGGLEDGYSFTGLIGNVLFYTSVLTSSEAYSNYQIQKRTYGIL